MNICKFILMPMVAFLIAHPPLFGGALGSRIAMRASTLATQASAFLRPASAMRRYWMRDARENIRAWLFGRSYRRNVEPTSQTVYPHRYGQGSTLVKRYELPKEVSHKLEDRNLYDLTVPKGYKKGQYSADSDGQTIKYVKQQNAPEHLPDTITLDIDNFLGGARKKTFYKRLDE